MTRRLPPIPLLPPSPGAVTITGVTDTDMTVWGAGITQNIDAAATELYLNWRHFSADVTCATGGSACVGGKLQVEDFDAVIGGARVKF
jgi:hypothetical protein